MDKDEKIQKLNEALTYLQSIYIGHSIIKEKKEKYKLHIMENPYDNYGCKGIVATFPYLFSVSSTGEILIAGWYCENALSVLQVIKLCDKIIKFNLDKIKDGKPYDAHLYLEENK